MSNASPDQTPVPQVLVLLAAYNGAAWITTQIESILAQEGVAVDIIVRDDRSRDDTAGVVASEFSGNPRVRIVDAEQASGSAGANFRELIVAVDDADFDYVAFADQDDVWLPQKLRAAVDGLRRSGAAGYSGAVEAFWPNGRKQILGQDSRCREADFLFEGAGQGCTFVLSRELFFMTQRFINENPDACGNFHYHDWLVYLVARSAGAAWYFDPQVVMQYRQHEGNEIGARGGWDAISKRLRLIRNGWYRRQLELSANLYLATSRRSPQATRLASLLVEAPKGRNLATRLKLFWWTMKWGRRRLSDRFVVAGAALAGWI